MRLGKYLKLFFIGAVCLYFLLVAVFCIREQEKKDLFRNQKLDKLESEYLVALNGYRILACFVFDQMVNTSRVQSIMAEAVDSPAERNRLRQELLAHLSPLYGQLAVLHFRQLHFHFPDSSSFLRFHRPEKFGDSLVGIRETVVAANTDLQMVSSFEEGRIFNGFRFVFPLFQGQQHVGSVEVSISSAALIRELSRVFGKQYEFVLGREVVKKKVFADELKNYGSCVLSPSLMHDLEARESTHDIYGTMSREVMRALNSKIADKFASEIKAWQPFIYSGRVGGKGYVVSFIPIKNYKGENAAYLLSFEEDSLSSAQSGNHVLTLVFLTLLFAAAFFFFFCMARSGKKLEMASSTDFLTEIWNRGKGYELLQHEHDRALRYDSHYSLIMFDVDRFKDVNDTFGHPVGDYVLKQVVKLVKGISRRSDSFSRWGGEEFLLLLPETSLENAVVFAEKIRACIYAYEFKYVGKVTVSLGVAEFSGETPLLDEVLHRVDKALYEAKNLGRNRVCQYSPVLEEDL